MKPAIVVDCILIMIAAVMFVVHLWVSFSVFGNELFLAGAVGWLVAFFGYAEVLRNDLEH